MPYTREFFFSTDAVEEAIAAAGIGPLSADQEPAWLDDVRHARTSHARAPRAGQAHHDRQARRAFRAHGLCAGRDAKPCAAASRCDLVSVATLPIRS
ncbi:MAG: 1,2-phenylacetyl-CoA epoxidase, subunit C (EC [uncultured Paraburkholderia sp.]|nr:MAG: 1,2-phenylacetyl-CoA epoxidase, subunit C (EC [uncultured Paraburkholderia sp.]